MIVFHSYVSLPEGKDDSWPPYLKKNKKLKRPFHFVSGPPQSSPVKEAIEDLDDYRL